MPHIEVPAANTDYICAYQMISFDQKFHITSWWPTSREMQYLQHLAVYACPNKNQQLNQPFNCAKYVPVYYCRILSRIFWYSVMEVDCPIFLAW